MSSSYSTVFSFSLKRGEGVLLIRNIILIHFVKKIHDFYSRSFMIGNRDAPTLLDQYRAAGLYNEGLVQALQTIGDM